MTSITCTCKPFGDITVFELYDIMALRAEVFVVEQNCPYLDADGVDLHSHHLQLRDQAGKLVAYTRLIPPGISYHDYASIGRVVNSPSVRGSGIGKFLMEESLRHMARLWPAERIKIGAQTYLLRFYEQLGFESTGEEYLEDGIPHTKMIYRA